MANEKKMEPADPGRSDGGERASGPNGERGTVPAAVRRQRMLDALRQREFLSVTELGQMFEISEVTVRSDLDTLAEEGSRHARARRRDGRAHGRAASGRSRR